MRPAARRRGEGVLLRIYLDELTLPGLLAARRESRRLGTRDVHVLEALPGGPFGPALRFIASALGLTISPETFFAGHLRTADGREVANLAAFRKANTVGMDAARDAVQSSGALRAMADEWPQPVVLLRIARLLWGAAFDALKRIEVAAALAARDRVPATLVLRRRPGITRAVGREPAIAIRWYGSGPPGRMLAARLTLFWWMGQRLSSLRFRCLAALGVETWRLSEVGRANERVVIVPQEEEASSDWSHRTQPHWLPHASPDLRVVMLADGPLPGETGHASLTVVSREEVGALPTAPAVAPALRRSLARASLRLLWCSAEEAPALAAAARLVYNADRMAAVAARTGATAFVAGENVKIQADAMQLVARALGVNTVSFQYSNMGRVTLPMLTALDRLLTFGPAYHDRWQWDGWRGSCVANGYPFDYAFDLVRHRARQHREALARRGARFVIAYFDESVEFNRWGLIHPGDRSAELRRLADLVIEDASIGVVLKIQFQQNRAGEDADLRSRMEAARGTGRLLELSHGRHRNIVFPAEAAMTADIAVGHMVGATASLEAALAGCRSLLLNPYGYAGANDRAYASGDIVYGSMAEALDAIRRFWSGDPQAARLGDWTDILPAFDPFRDGRAADRLRAFLTSMAPREDALPASHRDPACAMPS